MVSGGRLSLALGYALVWVACAGCSASATTPSAIVVEERGLWRLDEAKDALAANGEPVQALSFGFSPPLWMQVAVEGPGVFEVAHTQLDQVDIWVGEQTYRLGDHQTFGARPLRHPTYAVVVPPDTQTIWMRVESEGPMAVPLRFWPESAFDAHRTDLGLGLGLFFGFLLALSLYNGFLAISLRSSVYGLYAVWLLALVLSQAGFSGYAAMHLWPSNRWATNAMPALLLCLSAAAGVLFVDRMIGLREVAPRWSKATRWTAMVFVMLMGGLAIDYGHAVLLLPAAGFVAIAAVLGAVTLGVRRKVRSAYFLAAGAFCFLPSYFHFALAMQGVVPMDFAAQHGIKIGTCIEALVLSFALADRIALLEKHKLQAQQVFSQKLLQAQDQERRRLSSELHDGVGQTLGLLAGRLRGEEAKEAKQCIDELRRMAHDLYPDVLERLGLQAACRRVVEATLDRAGIEYTVSIDDVDGWLTRTQALHLYRVLQEGLSNLRHAEASFVAVRLVGEGDASKGEVLLEVQDDGEGIGDAPAGLGIASMRERARVVGGRLRLGRREGGGTCLRMVVPALGATSG